MPAKLAGPVLLYCGLLHGFHDAVKHMSLILKAVITSILVHYIMLLTPLRAWTMEINFASMKKTNVCNITCALPGPGPS